MKQIKAINCNEKHDWYNPHKLIKDFWNAVNNRQKVSCNILTDSMAYLDNMDGKDVIVIHVPLILKDINPTLRL